MRPEQPTCSFADQTLRLSDGDMSGNEYRAARAHLAQCATCRALLEDVSAVEAIFARSVRPALSTEDITRLAAVAMQTRRPLDHTWRTWLPSWVLAAASLLLVLGMGAYLGMASGARDTTVADDRVALTSSVRRDLADTRSITRAHAATALAGAPLDASAAALLVGLLASEPNANVRLALLDALERAELGPTESAAILALIATEPVPALRIELIELSTERSIPGTQQLLQQLASDDKTASVRRAAMRALAEPQS